MSKRGIHRGVRTFSVPVRGAKPWRRVYAAIPAVALIGGGIALATPANEVQSAAATKTSPAIVVPGTALTMPPVPAGPGSQEAPGLTAPGLTLSEGTAPGSQSLVPLDRTGIPARALEAYRLSASLVRAADPACHLDWALPAAIGRVESDHARFAGNQLDSAGVARPGIIGIPLDGTNNTARITDTDGGRLDRDTSYDRAVGPMQFIPGTWRVLGSDGDGDGSKNPQDMADAATSTGVYLCSGPGDLRRPDDLLAAILRYNHSDSYVQTVTAIANAYRHGVSALPAADLPAANPAPSAAGPSRTNTARTARPPKNSPTPRPGPPTVRKPAAAAPAPATAPPTTRPATPPIPAPRLPAPTIPGQSPTGPPLPSPPLVQQLCTVSPLGVRTCTSTPPS